MRPLALLLLPALAFAAPVLKSLKKPAVELVLSADSPLVLEVSVRNNGRVPLELPYPVTPLEQLDIDLRGETGKRHTIRRLGEDDAEAVSGVLTIPAGKSEILSVHTCHSLPEVGGTVQKITYTARLTHDGKCIESEPLTVNP